MVFPPHGAGEGCGDSTAGMGTARPAKPPLLLARVPPCRHLQHFPSFLLTPRPSAKGGFSASFQQDHSVPTDDSAPPSKASCFTPTPVLLWIFLVRHLCSLPLPIPIYSQTFAVGFFLIKLRSRVPVWWLCLYIALCLWHATLSQSFVAHGTGVMWPGYCCSLWLCPFSPSPQLYLVIGRCCPFTLRVEAARSTKYKERKLFSTKLPAVWKTKEAYLLLHITLSILDASSYQTQPRELVWVFYRAPQRMCNQCVTKQSDQWW